MEEDVADEAEEDKANASDDAPENDTLIKKPRGKSKATPAPSKGSKGKAVKKG